MDQDASSGRLHPWALASLGILAVIIVLWTWAGITPVRGSGGVVASGPQYTSERDDGLPWQVTQYRSGGRAEAHVDIRRRGPLPARIVAAPEVDAGPPRDAFCGWWPDRLLLDGEDVTNLDEPYPLPRDEPVELVLSGTFLGEPGCLEEGRIGARRSLILQLSILGAPKSVRVQFPVVLTWSTTPEASATQLRDRSVTPRVGTAP